MTVTMIMTISSVASSGQHRVTSAVVLELERDGLIELAQPGDDLLQLVLALAR